MTVMQRVRNVFIVQLILLYLLGKNSLSQTDRQPVQQNFSLFLWIDTSWDDVPLLLFE